MRDVVEQYRAWRAEGVGVGRGVVVRVYRSAPRMAGATMLVADDGRIAGSVSGGCVEGDVVGEVRAARREGRSRLVRYGISDEDARGIGLACGGTIDVLIEPEVPAEVAAAAEVPAGSAVARLLPPRQRASGAGERVSAVAPASGTLTIDAAGATTGSLGDAGLDAEVAAAAVPLIAAGTPEVVETPAGDVFVEVVAAPPHLVLVGAGEVAAQLVPLARRLGYRTTVIDGRSAFATPERFPEADQLLIGWADDLADRAGIDADACVAVLTHDPKFDDPALEVALRRGARYVGALGSRKTHAERLERLRAMGLTDEQLARIRGPIGLDLGGRRPPEVALAILAEIVAVRYGRIAGMERMPGGDGREDGTAGRAAADGSAAGAGDRASGIATPAGS